MQWIVRLTDPRALWQTKQEQDDADNTNDDHFSSTFAQDLELVDQCRDASLEHAELTVDAQSEQHDEEQHRPERRYRHHRYAFRVRDERQARTYSAVQYG